MPTRRFLRTSCLRSGKGVCNVKLRMESVELRKIPFLDATPQLYTLNSTFSILPARGEWFVRSAAKDSVTHSDVAVSGPFRRTYEVRSRYVDSTWNLVKVTRRGFGVANEDIVINMIESGFGVIMR